MPKREGGAQAGWSSASDVLRQVQEMSANLADAARNMVEEVSSSPAGRFAAPIARLGERTVELSTLWVEPMRAMLDEQQQFLDAVSTWAEEQKKLADRFAELARRHRELSQQTMNAITPVLDQADWLRGLSTRASGTKKSAST